MKPMWQEWEKWIPYCSQISIRTCSWASSSHRLKCCWEVDCGIPRFSKERTQLRDPIEGYSHKEFFIWRSKRKGRSRDRGMGWPCRRGRPPAGFYIVSSMGGYFVSSFPFVILTWPFGPASVLSLQPLCTSCAHRVSQKRLREWNPQRGQIRNIKDITPASGPLATRSSLTAHAPQLGKSCDAYVFLISLCWTTKVVGVRETRRSLGRGRVEMGWCAASFGPCLSNCLL